MPLTDIAVRNARARSKAYKISDGGSLYLYVTPVGSKLWRMAYRFNNKEKTLAFGAYPVIGLGDARRMKDDAKRTLAGGVDPGELKKRLWQAAFPAESSFEKVAREWFQARRDKWVPSYSTRLMSRLEGDIFPEIGQRPIDRIEPPELLEAIRKIERRGAPVLAGRLRAICGQVFRYAIAEGRAVRDPSADLRGALASPPPQKHRSALKESELPQFLVRLVGYDGDRRTALALKLTLLTFVRTNELRFASWPEFEKLDTAEPLWRIPAARMKKRAEHLVPLPPQAVQVLGELKGYAPGDAVFPGEGRKQVMSENTMLYALYRMGYHSRATVHGFRATASTILNERGFRSDWIERQLAHVEANQVRRAYNAAEYLSGRRAMMNWWGDFVQQQEEIGLLVG